MSQASHKYLECRSNRWNRNNQDNGTIQRAFIGWDYKTWVRSHHCGEYGYIGVKCVKTHFKKRNTNVRFMYARKQVIWKQIL